MRQLNFNFGTQVQGTDGHCGKLAGLVIKPDQQQVTDLIVAQGFLMPQKHIVPFSLVQNTQDNQVNLSVSKQELTQYPVYKVIEYEEPTTGLASPTATGLEHPTAELANPYGPYGALEPTVPTIQRKIHEGFGPDKKAIEHGMLVNNGENTLGKLDQVIIDCAHKTISYLVAQQGMIFSEQTVIPGSLIEHINDDYILVSRISEPLKHLPYYGQITGVDNSPANSNENKVTKGAYSMNIQGTKLDVLQAIAEIQEVTGVELVEDMQIAEEVELDISVVRSSLHTLANAGIVKLKKVETLSGTAYNVLLTQKGETVLAENKDLIQERLAQL